MTGRRAIVGLSLLSALVFCAFAAPSATALKGTRAFRCLKVEPPGEEFSDEHCKTPHTGGKGFTQMEIKTLINITVTNSKTGSELVSPKFRGVAAGVEFELEAGSFHSCVNKTTLENKENASKQFEAVSKFCGEFSSVTVTAPAKCEVEKGVIKLLESGTGRTVVKENGKKQQEMYIEFTPPEEKPFSEFTFAGGECVLKGAKVSVTGSAKAHFSTNESQNEEGATLNFTTAETVETLKAAGNEAQFEATFTPRDAGGEQAPITLTTTVP